MPPVRFAATRLAPVQGVVLELKGSQHLLVNTNSGSRCVLNAMGRRIWAMLAGRPTFPALVGGLSGSHDQKRGEFARDAGRLLLAWQEAGLITWTS
jgi:coenzyme PQQ synthesis protein D (PqqD)